MIATTKLKAVEQMKDSLQRDYRLLKKGLADEDIDSRTQVLVNRLGRTIEDARAMLTEFSDQLQLVTKK